MTRNDAGNFQGLSLIVESIQYQQCSVSQLLYFLKLTAARALLAAMRAPTLTTKAVTLLTFPPRPA